MSDECDSGGWFVVGWSRRIGLLTLEMVRFGLHSSELTNPGRINAYWHFARPVRVVFSNVKFHAEVAAFVKRPADHGMTSYRILIPGNTSYIEIVAEAFVAVRW